jgi:hypothetical protein
MVERRIRHGVSTWAAALICAAVCLPPAAQAASSPAPDPGERTRDCTTEAKLTDQPSVVRYVVWCGTQAGRVTLKIRQPEGPALLGFSKTAEAGGPGAAGPLRCRSIPGGRALCSGEKTGPVTFRGSITVAPATRCRTLIYLNVWRWTGDSRDFPTGCPRAYDERPPRVRAIIGERASEGLDLDLDGDRKAILQRAKQLQAAWFRGEPVARWTAMEEAWGMPMRAQDQVEMEYRETYREHFQLLVEDGDWVAKNAASTYAGYELAFSEGGIVYVGFTAEQDAMLEKLRQRLIAPERFQPFPIPPTYTEAELEKIWFEFPRRKSALWSLVNQTYIDYLANKIAVGTEHVARVKRLIAKLYGPDAPFKVVFGRPVMPLSG